MTITIIGAGAIGGLAGAYMTRAGHDVLLVDRWREHVDALNASGLFIDGVRGEMTVPVRAATPDQLAGPLGMVLVATKSQHAVDAVRQVLPLLRPDSAVVSYQNGFNEPDIVAPARRQAGFDGKAMVIGSIPNYGGALVDPGYIEFVHEGPIQLGEMDGRRTTRLEELAPAAVGADRGAGLRQHLGPDLGQGGLFRPGRVLRAGRRPHPRDLGGRALCPASPARSCARRWRSRRRTGSRSRPSTSSTPPTTGRRRRPTRGACSTTSTTRSGC